MYRFSKCKRPLPLSINISKGVPLPAEDIEVVDKDLKWEEIVVSAPVS